ncbi:M23 family metallopeptidase [Kribbella qitaiheensis]|uniref:M23 family metallopeptidase n=1 Tax=Kribbella qitaiheensis TaxID=1544730 RepID=A0A7G6X0B0_9ACTN|nr:phage tail tip lysozyme [Kribbella qitaiheensis]QNE19675.1 M23 family metallopeptidase [Kribbella qitaiheensis]
MEGKALPALGVIGLVLVLPLLIVLAMLGGAMGALGSDSCGDAGSETQGAAFGWPTSSHDQAADWSDQHKGVDYNVAKDSPVLAAEDGEVTAVDGDWITIQHDKRIETRYKFFSSKAVKKGQKVKRGDEIGKSGSGTEDEPGVSGEHLHFELWASPDGKGALQSVDPQEQVGDNAAPASTGGCSCGGPLSGSNNQQKAFNYFVSNGYSKEQAAGIVGNMIDESSVEPMRMQNTLPGTKTPAADVDKPGTANDYGGGWGIVQWTPPSKMITPSRSSGAKDEQIETLEFQLEFLKVQLTGKGPAAEGQAGTMLRATKSVEDAAVAFARYYERFGGNEDPNHPRYAKSKASAKEVLANFGNAAGGGGASGGCAGAGNGSIVETAFGLAWRDRGHGQEEADATEAYQKAMPQFNGSTGTWPFSDCGVYVATVMVMSGVDKTYVKRGTGGQRDYVQGSSKYQVFENLNNVSQLQPGDIFVNDGHTYIYVGTFKGTDGMTWNALSASLGSSAGNGRVPQPSIVQFVDGHGQYTVARIKKQG